MRFLLAFTLLALLFDFLFVFMNIDRSVNTDIMQTSIFNQTFFRLFHVFFSG